MADAVQAQNPLTSKAPIFIRRTTPVGTRTHKGLWLCQCGNQFEASLPNVARGHTRSCGCEQARSQRMAYPIHGHSWGKTPRSPTYKSWQAMIARCTYPKHPAFPVYGGRGITVCEQWLKSFSAFLTDMGVRPEGMTLDRYPDSNGNYVPGNVRWASPEDQSNNRNTVATVSIGDLRLPVAVVCKRYRSAVSVAAVNRRLDRGWSLFDAITKVRTDRDQAR